MFGRGGGWGSNSSRHILNKPLQPQVSQKRRVFYQASLEPGTDDLFSQSRQCAVVSVTRLLGTSPPMSETFVPEGNYFPHFGRKKVEPMPAPLPTSNWSKKVPSAYAWFYRFSSHAFAPRLYLSRQHLRCVPVTSAIIRGSCVHPSAASVSPSHSSASSSRAGSRGPWWCSWSNLRRLGVGLRRTGCAICLRSRCPPPFSSSNMLERVCIN